MVDILNLVTHFLEIVVHTDFFLYLVSIQTLLITVYWFKRFIGAL